MIQNRTGNKYSERSARSRPQVGGLNYTRRDQGYALSDRFMVFEVNLIE